MYLNERGTHYKGKTIKEMPPNRLRRDFIDEEPLPGRSTHDICLNTMWNERNMELEELDTVITHFSPAGRELCHLSAVTNAALANG